MDSTILQPEAAYPTEWRRMSFEDFTVLKRGKDLTREQFREGKVPVAGSNGVIGYHDTANVSAPGVTVGRSGSVGKVNFYEEDFWAHNTALFVSDFHGNYPPFVCYFLEHLRLGRFGSGASVPTLDRNIFRALPVTVPIPVEQRKIASVLGLVQRAIEQQERLIALTTELKKSLMHKLFTEGLHSERQKQTEIGPVPESWELAKIGDLFETQLGKMLSQKARVGDDPKPYLRNKNVQWGVIDTTDLLSMDFKEREREKFILVPGDLLICEGGEPGRAAIWVGTLKECYYQKALHRLRPKSDIISNEYLAYWLEFALRYQDLYGVAGASSTIAHLPEVQLKMLQVPLADRNEQDTVVESLNAVGNKISVHQSKHSILTTLFRTLLHQLMTAQIRVHDLDLSFLEQEAKAGGVHWQA